MLKGLLGAIDKKLGFPTSAGRWTPPPPAHVLDMLVTFATAEYQTSLTGGLPLLEAVPWDRTRMVLTTLRARDGALDVDHLVG